VTGIPIGGLGDGCAKRARACRKPRPHWSDRVSVLVEDGTQPIMSFDREPGDCGGSVIGWGCAQWPGVGDALVGPVPGVMLFVLAERVP
jgi:hypothetical protein